MADYMRSTSDGDPYLDYLTGFVEHPEVVTEVEIDRRTSQVWPRNFTVAHDCGLI